MFRLPDENSSLLQYAIADYRDPQWWVLDLLLDNDAISSFIGNWTKTSKKSPISRIFPGVTTHNQSLIRAQGLESCMLRVVIREDRQRSAQLFVSTQYEHKTGHELKSRAATLNLDITLNTRLINWLKGFVILLVTPPPWRALEEGLLAKAIRSQGKAVVCVKSDISDVTSSFLNGRHDNILRGTR